MRPRAYRAFMLIAFAIVVALWFKIPTVRSASVVSILVAGIILALSVASILPLPRYIVRKSTNSLALKELSATDRLKAENDVRGTLFQAIGGALLLLGAFLTWQQVQSGAEQVRVSQRQLEIGQEGQITERFTRAIDQLGSKSIDVRLGGIYALERIAKNSPQDQDAITDILSAYVRGHSPWKPTASQGQRLNTVDSEYSRKLSELRVLEVRAGDIQGNSRCTWSPSYGDSKLQ
jgi:hypothetical protein